MVIEVIEAKDQKQSFPIDVTLLGMVIEVIEAKDQKQ